MRIDVAITASPAAAPAEGTARRSDGSTVAMAPVAYTPNRAQPQPAPTTFTVTADASGKFTVTYRPTRPGRYTFTATGLTSGRIASATGTVLPPRPTRSPHHGGLPVTGDSIGTPLKLGGAPPPPVRCCCWPRWPGVAVASADPGAPGTTWPDRSAAGRRPAGTHASGRRDTMSRWTRHRGPTGPACSRSPGRHRRGRRVAGAASPADFAPLLAPGPEPDWQSRRVRWPDF
ncbi:hypothetical protein V2I01_36040 [Micromonospora sp. BRA006-A]|nr:hypothetical protein [Micromonospora sp. BRA006-A]